MSILLPLSPIREGDLSMEKSYCISVIYSLDLNISPTPFHNPTAPTVLNFSKTLPSFTCFDEVKFLFCNT